MGLASYLKGTPGPSGFGSASTAEDVTAGLDLHSKTIIVSGATSGIGKETARVLAKRGAHIIMAVRNTIAGEKVRSEISRETPNARVDVMLLDLSSLQSIRKFADEFKSRHLPLNVLINNAGLMMGEFTLSEDKLEKVFATNHIGTFLLTKLLLGNLKATAEETGEEGRIVNISSEAHKWVSKGGIVFDKLNSKRFYSSTTAYGQSKLANVLHAKELAKHFQEEGANVTANSLHPGVIMTNFLKGKSFLFRVLPVASKVMKTIPQGAATTCYIAAHPGVEGVSGKYFISCNETSSISTYASDPELSAKLWKYSEEFVSTH